MIKRAGQSVGSSQAAFIIHIYTLLSSHVPSTRYILHVYRSTTVRTRQPARSSRTTTTLSVPRGLGIRSNLNLQLSWTCSMLIYFPRLLREHTCIHAYTAKSKRQGGWVHDTLIIIFTLPTHPRDIHRRTRSEARALPYLTPYVSALQTKNVKYLCYLQKIHASNMQCSMQEPMQGPRSNQSFASAAERAQLLLSVRVCVAWSRCADDS
jgi:hypothetical protein